MKISARINGLLVKRLVIILIMLFSGWNLFSAIKRDNCFFPIGKIFSVGLFLSNKIEPIGMSMSVMGNIARDVKKIWKEEKLEIVFVPEELKSSERKNFSTDNPTMCVFYHMDYFQGKMLRRYVDFEYNKKFSDLILREDMPAKSMVNLDEEEVSMGKLIPWQWILREANQFNEVNYGKLKKEFPGLVYSFEELRTIRANGIMMSAIHTLAHLKFNGRCGFDGFIGSSRNFKFSDDSYMNQSAVMYSPFFYGKFKKLCWWEDVKHKSGIFLPILAITFLSFHFRRGLASILSQELLARRMEINFRRRAWLCLRYWRHLLFPFSQSRLLRIVANICDHCIGCADREQKIKVAREALLLSEELKKELGDDDFSKDRYLQNLLEIAQGKGDKMLAYRENCLCFLGAFLKKLREKDVVAEVIPLRVPYQNSNNGPCASRAKAKARIAKREVLLSKLKILLPKTCSLEFDSWRNSELDDLCLTLRLLKIISNDLPHIFLGRPNFEALVKNKLSPFMVAVKADRREEVSSILKEFGASNRFADDVRDRCVFPKDLEIDVIFGEGPWGRSPQVKKALLALGARKVNCYEASKAGKLLSVAERTSGRRIIVTTCPPHGHGHIVRGSQLPNFNVQATNVELFAKEVAKKIHMLNIN